MACQVLVAGDPAGIVDHRVAELHRPRPAAVEGEVIELENRQLAGRHVGVLARLDPGVD